MGQMLESSFFAVGLFLGMLLMLEVGHRIGARRRSQGADGARGGLGAVEGSVFGLMGLLVAFTFSGAASRFDARRALIVEEVNQIGTAYQRLDLLPEEPRSALQEKFRAYLDARLEGYRALPDKEAAFAALARAGELQREIWQESVEATRALPSTEAAMLLLPALNATFDIATTRLLATEIHPPTPIFVLLGALALVCSLIAGYGMANAPRSWLHVLGFAFTLALTVYVILDLEFPRLGLLRVQTFDRALVELRARMD
jgi:hypothetical protein